MNEKNKPRFSPLARHYARCYALQALYQWHMTGDNLGDIEIQFLMEENIKDADLAFFQELLHGIPKHLSDIDAQMNTFLDRRLEELNPVELMVMRIGIYELLFRLDIPYRVIINESLEIAKLFGATEGHKYVNGVLDKVAHIIRKDEIKSK